MSLTTLTDRCKQILVLMRQAGYTDVCEPENVDNWTISEIWYFHDNYAPHYLKEAQ